MDPWVGQSLDGHPSLEREAPWSCKIYIPQYRGMPGPRNGSGGGGKWREGMGDFWDSIGM